MARYRADIEVPDNATWQELEEAKATAVWRKIFTLEDRKARTDLSGKCGSCENYRPHIGMNGYEYCKGICHITHAMRDRTSPICQLNFEPKK